MIMRNSYTLNINQKRQHNILNVILQLNEQENWKVMKKRNVIKIDLSGCKNWSEVQKVIELVSSGKVKIKVEKL